MRVEIEFQRAEVIQLIQDVDGKQYEKLENAYMLYWLMLITGFGNNTKSTQSSMSKEETSKPAFQRSTTPLHTILTKILSGKPDAPDFYGSWILNEFLLEKPMKCPHKLSLA